MPSREAMQEVGSKLFDLLSMENKELLLLYPSSALSKDQLAVLTALHHHFNGLPEEDPRRGPGRPPKKPRTPSTTPSPGESWGSIRRIRRLDLHRELMPEVSSWRLQDDAPSLLSTLDPLPKPTGDDTADQCPLDALALYCFHAKKLHALDRQTNPAPVLIHIRWLFTVLFVGDFLNTRLMSGPLLPEGEWKALEQRITTRCGEMVNTEKIELGFDIDDDDVSLQMIQHARKLLVCGDRLVFMCEKFTTGCIFYLQGILSEHFLFERFTKSGQFYDQAVKVLAKLRLTEKAEESGASGLGDAMRIKLGENIEIDDALEKEIYGIRT